MPESIAMILALSFPTHFHLKSYNIQRSFICKSRNSHRCIIYIIKKKKKKNVISGPELCHETEKRKIVILL